MKILISAYACEPNRGSEPGVGWHTAWELAKRHEVWVLTRPDDGRSNIEAELARNPNPNLHFVYFTLPVLGGFWQWGSVAFVLHYYLWQVQAYFVARRLHQEMNFDIAHHVTFVRYSTPSFISLLPIPFVWGPVGGGESTPQPFWSDFAFKARIYEFMRAFAHKVGELDPFTSITARRSAITRVTTKDTAERVSYLGANKIEIVPEAGLSRSEIANLSQCALPEATPVRFISMGRLLHWKGFHLGLRAFAKAGLTDSEYWILGDGVERDKLELLVEALSISDRVKFWGALPRSETLNKLGQCQVLVHPSLHDSGGWVCLEAMAAGRPIICLDLGGPAVQVSEATGIKISAQDPEQVTADLAEAMKKMASDRKMRIQMGLSGRKTVTTTYNWESKGKRLSELYQQILTNNLRLVTKL